MCIVIGVSIAPTIILMLLAFAIMQKLRCRKIRIKGELALKGIASSINGRLHAAYPSSKWRWVCYPAGFALNGGIARIEVINQSNKVFFLDVCLAKNGYMALHVSNVDEVLALDVDLAPTSIESPVNTTVSTVSATAPVTGVKPNDKESVNKWYNIILINALTTLIDDLNAKGEVSLYIGQDGKAYVEESDSNTVIYDFGEMPEMSLWDHVTERLGDEGLFAEVQEGNCIFISWA